MEEGRCYVSDEGPCRSAPVRRLEDGSLEIEFEGGSRLYQLSVLADARDFDWESQYHNVTAFHNRGQRTGPWDFSFWDNNRPLAPSYWFELDGERIGLWYFERVRLEDIDHKRFRGRAAFWLRRPGTHRLKLTPYREAKIRWISANIEPDPEDRLDPLPAGMKSASSCCPWTAWSQEAFWTGLRSRLEGAAALYREPLARACAWVLARPDPSIDDVPLLMAAYRIDRAPDGLERIRKSIDACVRQADWGNPREDGYGHNGDMAAAIQMLGLTQALHMLGDDLDGARRERMLAKLRLQGERFVRLALLNRDYWGGSLLQDHGWRSVFFFGAAALGLYGLLPEADTWLQWALPRVRRSLAAMPRDGSLPPSSYWSLYLYLDPVMRFRDAWRAASGEDVLDQPPFRPIVAFVRTLLKPPENVMLLFRHGPAIGAPDFFLAMAAKHGDGDALWVHDCILDARCGDFYHATQTRGYYDQAIWGLAAWPDGQLPERPPAASPARADLAFFRDSGLVHYRNDSDRVAFTIQAGPWCGYHAYRHARGPCDRLAMTAGPMQFALFLDGAPVLVMPESGYRLKAFLCPCLLVDDQGPYGDIGYPMSIPSWRDRGEEIEDVRWDAMEQRGLIRLNLAPAYTHLDVCGYAREFIVAPGRIVCRDTVALDRPSTLTWLFHARRQTGVRIEAGQVAHFGDPTVLTLTPHVPGVTLRASVHATDVVWSYASYDNFAGYDHVRYDTAAPVGAVVTEFALNWSPRGS